jgi:hypothetical protein
MLAVSAPETSSRDNVSRDKFMRRVVGLNMRDHIPHDAVCTLTQFFCDIVSFVDYEILVEHLKILPTSHVRHLVTNLALAERLGG